jgi:hypothetical protein
VTDSIENPGEVQLQFATEQQMVDELERRGATVVMASLRRDGKNNEIDWDFMDWRGHALKVLGMLSSATYRINQECASKVEDGSD